MSQFTNQFKSHILAHIYVGRMVYIHTAYVEDAKIDGKNLESFDED